MDCWGEAGDFVVPNHLELSDIFPSDYCLGWAASERFGPPNKYGASATNLTREELNFGGSRSHDEVKNETFIHEEESSTDTSRCGGFPLVDYSGGNSEASRDGTGLLDDWQDYQIDGIDNMDQMDDSFLGSLLEDTSPDMENPYRPVSMFPELECNTMSFHNLLNDMLLDSWCISRDLSGIHSLKNLNTHSFSSREESTPLFMLSNSGQIKGSSMTKVPATVLIPAELENLCATDGHLSVGKSLEESVLQELEVVMTQLTKNTRICFRDALYRLAKSLEQQHMGSQSQSGEITMDKCSLSTVHNETSRFRRANPAQFETNTIDRTIETLMFKKLNCDAPNLSSVAPVNFGEESVKTTGTPNYSLKQTPILPYTHISVLPHDAEVPIFGRNNQTAIDSYKNFKNRPSTRI